MAKRSKKPASAASVALNPAAPVAERYDASAEVTKGALAQTLFPPSDIQPVIDLINDRMAEADMHKAAMQITYAGEKRLKRGMQSISIDEFQVASQGAYWDRPGILNFDSMRAMVDQTPILNAIILTRINQIKRFCRPQLRPYDPGFVVEHIDPNLELTEENKRTIDLLQKFVVNSGWEDDPRRRKILKRDTFPQFMAKRVRDALTLDAAPVETEFKNDRNMGLDGIYAVDGASIRLCTEDGYNGEDEYFAVQVVQGNVRTAYSHYDLVYEVRNPRSDVLACGYGYSETEMLIRIVTYLVNTLTFNGEFFNKNAIPRGILQLAGNYDNNDLAAFKRIWLAQVRGIQNAHNLPLLVAKEPEAKAEFTEIGGQLNEMAFGKWMSLLTSIACAVYGIAPEEVSMESYTAGKSSLSGSDTEQKITSSTDKGLAPLLAHFGDEYSDYFIRCFSPQYRLSFKGLNAEDADKRFEMRKLNSTWNESRRDDGKDEIEGEIGDCPLNPALQGPWMAIRQEKMAQEQQDFGMPPDGNSGEPLPGGNTDPGAATGGAPQGDDREGDFGAEDGEEQAKPARAEVEKALASRFGLPNIYAVT
jgi:hypothetical protein